MGNVAASLKPDEISAIIASPFSERSKEILSAFPDIHAQVGGMSLLHHLHVKLGNADQPVAHTSTLHAQWTTFTEQLTNGSINPLTLTPEEYFHKLRSLPGVQVDDATPLGPPFDITIVKLLELQTLMKEFVHSLDKAPSLTGMTPIYGYREALQEKLGGSFTLPEVGTVEYTPLGIVLHLSPECLKENDREAALGLNIRGLETPQWNGAISIVATEAYFDPRNSTHEDLNTREHELRHALQYLLRPVSGVSFAALNSEFVQILAAREAGTLNSAESRVRPLVDSYAERVISAASEEMASYLSQGEAHTPLSNSHLGTKQLTTALRLIERALWQATIPEEEKQSLFLICSETCQKASSSIHRGQAGIELATSRGIRPELLRSAIESGGLKDLPQALVAYGLGENTSAVEGMMARYLSQRIIGAEQVHSTFFESLRDLRHYHQLFGTPECPPWREVYGALLRDQSEKPIFGAVIAYAASQGSELAKHLQQGTVPELIAARRDEIALLYSYLAPPVTTAMMWLSSASPLAALNSLLPNLAEYSVTDPIRVTSSIKEATEHLRLTPSGAISQEDLNKFELDAVKARTTLAIANDSWAPLDTEKGDEYFAVRCSLDNLINQLHIQSGMGGGFHLYGGDAHLNTLIGPPSESPTLDDLRAIALHAPEWSRYWTEVTRDLVAQLNHLEDLPCLLMIAQNTENLSLAANAATSANRLISQLSPEEQPYARQFLDHRIDLIIEARRRNEAWSARQQRSLEGNGATTQGDKA